MIDELISKRLTNEAFLRRLLNNLQERTKKSESGQSRERITTTIASLSKERERVLKSFEKGYRSEEQTDKMIAKIDADLTLAREELAQHRPIVAEMSPEAIAEYFSPCEEWEFLTPEQRRQILTSLVSEIHVDTDGDDPKITGLC
jgi:ElaB/YqjD/DUF883 family membrane-anchored ribosome-binding protein